MSCMRAQSALDVSESVGAPESLSRLPVPGPARRAKMSVAYAHVIFLYAILFLKFPTAFSADEINVHSTQHNETLAWNKTTRYLALVNYYDHDVSWARRLHHPHVIYYKDRTDKEPFSAVNRAKY